MACMDSNDQAGDVAHQLQEEINELSRLLCSQCRALENSRKTETLIRPEVREWWEAHKLADLQREKREAENRRNNLKYKKDRLRELEREVRRLEEECE